MRNRRTQPSKNKFRKLIYSLAALAIVFCIVVFAILAWPRSSSNQTTDQTKTAEKATSSSSSSASSSSADTESDASETSASSSADTSASQSASTSSQAATVSASSTSQATAAASAASSQSQSARAAAAATAGAKQVDTKKLSAAQITAWIGSYTKATTGKDITKQPGASVMFATQNGSVTAEVRTASNGGYTNSAGLFRVDPQGHLQQMQVSTGNWKTVSTTYTGDK